MSDEICVKFPPALERPEGYIKYFSPPKVEGALKIPIDKFPLDLLQELMNTPGGMGISIEIQRVWLTGGLSISHTWDGTDVNISFESNDINITPAK